MIKIVYVTEKHPNAHLIVKEWNMSDARPVYSKNFLWGVQHVEASGDELGFLTNNFKNLPMCEKNTVIWIGEFAKFIVSNFCELE